MYGFLLLAATATIDTGCGTAVPPAIPTPASFTCPAGTRRVDQSAGGAVFIQCLKSDGTDGASLMKAPGSDALSAIDRENGLSLMYTRERVVSWGERKDGQPVGLHIHLDDTGSLVSVFRFDKPGVEVCGRMFEDGKLFKKKDPGTDWIWLEADGKPRSSQPALSREELQREFARGMNMMKYCYERELAKQPALRGKVLLSVHIVKGRADRVDIAESSFPNDTVPRCVRDVVLRLEFPKVDQPVDVKYPFSFAPQ